MAYLPQPTQGIASTIEIAKILGELIKELPTEAKTAALLTATALAGAALVVWATRRT